MFCGVAGAAIVPSTVEVFPGFHLSKWRIAPPFVFVLVSTNATFVPSPEIIVEVTTLPVVSPLGFVL